jgi:hypothetical protein
MEIDKSLIKTIGENGAQDILSEMGELTLDSIIDNDSIGQIPIIGTLRSAYKITNSISDYLFIQKLLKFLKELNTLSITEKTEMKNRINNEEKYGKKVGENLLEIINKIDDNDKPKIISKIFKAYINKEIEFQHFLKFSQIVNKSYLPELLNLTEFYRGQSLTNENSSGLLSMGLIKISAKQYYGEISMRDLSEREQFEYILNTDGIKLMYILYPEFEIIR